MNILNLCFYWELWAYSVYLICVCIDNLAHSVYWFCVFFYALGHIHSLYRICVFVDNFEQAHSVYWFCVFVISLSRYFLIFIQEKSCCKQQQGSLKHFRILLTHFTPMFPFYSPRRQKTNRFPVFRSSPPEVDLRKGVLKICSKFTGEHAYRSVISRKVLCNFIQITHGHGCSPVNLLHIFRTLFYRNTSGKLLLCFQSV